MNITPNSFSDPGKNLDLQQFSNNLKYLRDHHVFCFDFGAESTAPKNAGLVDAELELKRFETYFLSRLHLFKHTDTFSIDSYRFETFLKVYVEIRKKFSSSSIIWNDVSGVIDADLDKFLELCLKDTNLKYVASFTYNETRELSSFHKERASENKQIVNDFKNMVFNFKKKFENSTKDALIIDPAFGFSKTMAQNFELLDFFSLHDSSDLFLQTELMIGLSKKSFLQWKCLETYPELELGTTELLERTEELHRNYLEKIYHHLTKQKLMALYLRIHDPKVITFL